MKLTNERILQLTHLLTELSTHPEALNNIPPNDPILQMVMQSLQEDKKQGRLPWVPTPKQKLLNDTQAYETLYGGGRGGGKSYALLAIARNNHKRSLILRRNFSQLEGSLIDDSKRFFGVDYYNLTRHVLDFPDGCLIRFGHCQNFDDIYQYDGQQYDLLAIDQVEQFALPMVQHLLGVTRTSDKGQRVRVIYTANPVGEGIDWLIERFHPWLDKSDDNPAEPGGLRWYARIDGKDTKVENGNPFTYKGELIEPRSRTFIPALVVDNPYLNKDYVATLQSFPEPLRSQLLYGRWDAGEIDDPYQVIKRSHIEAAMKRWTEDNPFDRAPLSLGVDCAHGGQDKSVIARCRGRWFDRLITRMGVETPDGKSLATLVAAEMTGGGSAMIDLVGWGSAAYEQLRDAGLTVIGINGGEKSEANDRGGQMSFANKRTEVYWKLREALDPAYGLDLRLPIDEELKSDLASAHWELVGGKIRVEPKEKTKERVGRSPDKGDAVAYAWAMAQQEAVSSIEVAEHAEYNIDDT